MLLPDPDHVTVSERGEPDMVPDAPLGAVPVETAGTPVSKPLNVEIVRVKHGSVRLGLEVTNPLVA